MKKQMIILAGLLALCPLTAAADAVSTGYMQIGYNQPVVQTSLGNWYTDYEITASSLGELALQSSEVFCVEHADLNKNYAEYAFYRIDEQLDTDYGGGDAAYLDKLIQASWIATWALTSNQTDAKTIGQLAIWHVMLGATIAETNSYYGQVMQLLYPAYNTAKEDGTYNDYVDDWLLAVNPAVTNGEIPLGVPGQNFLVKANNPVPEPATMFLFGTGMAGLAGMIRRKRS